jgi:hypothetical protein
MQKSLYAPRVDNGKKNEPAPFQCFSCQRKTRVQEIQCSIRRFRVSRCADNAPPHNSTPSRKRNISSPSIELEGVRVGRITELQNCSNHAFLHSASSGVRMFPLLSASALAGNQGYQSHPLRARFVIRTGTRCAPKSWALACCSFSIRGPKRSTNWKRGYNQQVEPSRSTCFRRANLVSRMNAKLVSQLRAAAALLNVSSWIPRSAQLLAQL